MAIQKNFAGTGFKNRAFLHFDGTYYPMDHYQSLRIDSEIQTILRTGSDNPKRDLAAVLDSIEQLIRTQLKSQGYRDQDYRLEWGPVYGTRADTQDILMLPA
jgi:hypothetical protein